MSVTELDPDKVMKLNYLCRSAEDELMSLTD